MITELDEFPIHQLPQPMAWPGSSDRNFYDRSYFNAHDRSGEIFLISGMGYYPNLGVKDAFVLIRRGNSSTAVHFSDAIDSDRLHPRIGGYSVEVVEPLRSLRLRAEPTSGIALDLRWEGLFNTVQELPHVMRTGNRITLDAQRFAQTGTWSGWIEVDGERIDVSPAQWVGARDRSWGIRPVGAPEPAGRPADPPFEGMWWIYIPMAFDDFQLVMIVQENPDGFRTLNDCTRVWKDGTVEQLGWPRISVAYQPGTRLPSGARISATGRDGAAVEFEVTAQLGTPLHVGGGYGGDPDWLHGQWLGENFAERVTYELDDPAVAGRIPFGVIDHVGHALCQEADGTVREGWGMFEHGALGRHDPSGFTDWLSVAPE